MVFRLVIENVGRRPFQFAALQQALESSMSIEQSDGTNMPYIATLAQTGMGQNVVLKPQERKVLLEGFDIAFRYLITSPGTYTVRFLGQKEAFGAVALPPSNAITIHVADGLVQPSRAVARKLIDTEHTSGWRVRIVEEGTVVPIGRTSATGATFILRSGPEIKANVLRALMWVTATPSAIEPSGQDPQRGRIAERIGRCPWGDVYLWSDTAPPEELRTVRELITTVLKADDR
jgi:hypothetical protein